MDGSHIGGWALDGDNPNAPLWLEITTPSGSIIRTRANLPRPDLKEAGIGTGCHGFEAYLRADDLAGEAEIIVKVAATGQVLSPSKRRSLSARLKRVGYRLRKQFTSPPTTPEAATIYATIGRIEGSHIEVWIDDGDTDVAPMIMIGDLPAWQAPEVRETSFMSRTGKAYDFYVSGLTQGDEISLWIDTSQQLELCETRHANQTSFERSIIKQLTHAAKVANQPGAVAVTCWEGGHNPMGRAKVLYDVLDGRRPVVLFAFLFSDFGGDIWRPLATSSTAIVTIPWSERQFFLRMARQMGIRFETVWMCKPRMPTFELASAIATPDAALILDIDDNEEAFSASKGSRSKAYGLTSIGLSRFTMENIPTRTSPSISIQKDFGTHIVRHARSPARKDKIETVAPLRVGFIGTVRPHKRIVEAAEAINALNADGQQRFEFHVYGDIEPASVRKALIGAGAVVKGDISFHSVPEHLARFHIILTGFPSETEDETPITRYQISSKIGDALSVGRPALIPAGASVTDLAEVPGLFLFDNATFADQLNAAAEKINSCIDLPDEFTLTGAYDAFALAEQDARSALRAGKALSHIPSPACETAATPTLLLLWKQHDAGLYGRRPDMLARAYAQAFPDHRVVMLEVLYPDFDSRYRADHSGLSEITYLRELNTRKSQAFTENGVEYAQLRVERSDQLNRALMEYLGARAILPTNTVIVIFPNILHLQRTYDLLSSYTSVADIVDNQLAWTHENQKKALIQQYFALCRMSDRVVFNSAQNIEAFRDKGLLSGAEAKVAHIPNWYQLPADFIMPPRDHGKKHYNIFYTGNMNDRVDWALFGDIAALDDRVRIHLVGEAGRSFEQLASLLETHPNTIFHGVKNERMTLQMLCQADLTIMPHLEDDVSKFMNPLKVHMYAALGLHTVASDIPGIVASDHLTIASDRDAFLEHVRFHIGKGTGRVDGFLTCPASSSQNCREYLNLIETLRTSSEFGKGRS